MAALFGLEVVLLISYAMIGALDRNLDVPFLLAFLITVGYLRFVDLTFWHLNLLDCLKS